MPRGARTALSESERRQLVEMADTWDALAEQREAFVKTHPELSRQATEAETNKEVETSKRGKS
jgi:hypothetical protein